MRGGGREGGDTEHVRVVGEGGVTQGGGGRGE